MTKDGYFLKNHYNGYVVAQKYLTAKWFTQIEVPYVKNGESYIRLKPMITPFGQKKLLEKYVSN